MEQYEREYCELATQIAKLKDVILTIGGEARRCRPKRRHAGRAGPGASSRTAVARRLTPATECRALVRT